MEQNRFGKEFQYQYIWMVLHKAILEKKNLSEIKYIVSKQLSPYVELNEEDINFFDSNKEIEINPYIRFNSIFQDLLLPTLEIDYERYRKIIFNIVVHILGYLDLQDGLNKRVIINRILIREIEMGYLGEKTRKNFKIFSRVEKLKIADSIYDMYRYSNSLKVFEDAVKKIFYDSIIYNNKFSDNRVVIYIYAEKTKENKLKIEFLKTIFLPIGLKIKVYWKYHFGVIGVKETMKIEELAIY